VPRVGEVVTATDASSSGAARAASGPLDLNTATLEQLDALPGVGPTTAHAIIDERERRGGFRSVDDLLDVRGIGPAKLDAIRDLVTV
jgi:competence protein ComEA